MANQRIGKTGQRGENSTTLRELEPRMGTAKNHRPKRVLPRDGSEGKGHGSRSSP